MSCDRPDARELVKAVAQWLAEDLAPGLEAGPRFQAMVAAQGLAIAARELALGPENAVADATALAPLVAGAATDDPQQVRQALSDAIASGRHDDDLTAVATVLREHVRRKLAVARPGYDTT